MAGIQQTQGSFDTGRQCNLVLVGPYGRIELPNITGFDAKQNVATIKVNRLDGVQMNAKLPQGWSGGFDLERGDSAVDEAFNAIEAGWFNSGSLGTSTIYQYIDEADGSTSCYQFDNVALSLADAGNWRSDQTVKQRIDFEANRRRSV